MPKLESSFYEAYDAPKVFLIGQMFRDPDLRTGVFSRLR